MNLKMAGGQPLSQGTGIVFGETHLGVERNPYANF